jgi:hypothetical protein
MVTQRSLFERDALFARWQKAIIVNLGQLGDARQAECLSNLDDVLGKAVAVIRPKPARAGLAAKSCKGRA